MYDDAVRSMLHALEAAFGVQMATLDDQSPELARAASDGLSQDDVTELWVETGRYLVCWTISQPAASVVAGPYRRPVDPPLDCPTFDTAAEQRLSTGIRHTQQAIAHVMEDRAQRLELVTRLELISDAVIAISSELSLDLVLRRIVDLAREVVGARYAALGVPDGRGDVSTFLVSGISDEDAAKIGDSPHWRGILGLLLREPRTLLLSDLSAHPASVGFPPHHPPMRSFLGVPIIARGRVLGNLYLTEKRFGTEFTQEDARLVEILARHAAVAIEHAQLYGRIEAARRQLQIVVDQLPEAVVVVGREPERILVTNRQASALLGWEIDTSLSLEQFLERNPRFRPDGTPIATKDIHMVRALRRGELVAHQEIELARPDGKRSALLVNAAPLLDERGQVTAAVVVFQDITQIKDAETLKDEFLSLVSHELRTPLTTIHGGAHLLLHDGARLDPETHALMLGDILSESRRLASLIENMVQLANIRAGRFSMDFEPIIVRSLVERAVAAVKGREPDRHLQTRIEPDLLALGDPGRLEQVLQNLLSNALKYSPAGSPIEIEAARVDDEVTITVRDHGPGIDLETLPHVFERFQRGEHARRSGASGMGLGLYLAKHLVEAHGGAIAIAPAPDGGTSVCFTIPAPKDDL